MDFEALVKKYDYMLRITAKRFNVAGYGRDDLYQVFLSTLWECSKRFDKTKKTSFKTYLYSSMLRDVHTLLKQQKPWMYNLDAEIIMNDEDSIKLADIIYDEDNTPEHEAMYNDDIKRSLEAIKTLGAERRMAIEMHLLEGKSFTEIAKILGVTNQAVTKNYRLGIKQLREKLN